MENDNKNDGNAWQQAICLLEEHLTRANRAQMLSVVGSLDCLRARHKPKIVF
jgi:hypothetical protein